MDDLVDGCGVDEVVDGSRCDCVHAADLALLMGGFWDVPDAASNGQLVKAVFPPMH